LGVTLEEVRSEIRNLLGNCENSPPVAPYEPPKPDTAEVIYFKTEIERLNSEKEAAVAACEFERAAQLRDQADKMRKLMVEFIARQDARDRGASPHRVDFDRVPNLPELMKTQAAIDRVLEERIAVLDKFDAEIRRLKAEQARIIAEWRERNNDNVPPQ
jgi:hypothetical protein